MRSKYVNVSIHYENEVLMTYRNTDLFTLHNSRDYEKRLANGENFHKVCHEIMLQLRGDE